MYISMMYMRIELCPQKNILLTTKYFFDRKMPKCLTEGCSFYGTRENQWFCSEHASPSLYRRPILLTETEILQRLEKSRDIFMSNAEERVLWLEKTATPIQMDCDDIKTAKEVLGLSSGTILSLEQAMKFIHCIDTKNVDSYTRIAFEKAIVIHTLCSHLLPTDCFPIGLCYHGQKQRIHQYTPITAIQNTFRYFFSR